MYKKCIHILMGTVPDMHVLFWIWLGQTFTELWLVFMRNNSFWCGNIFTLQQHSAAQ